MNVEALLEILLHKICYIERCDNDHIVGKLWEFQNYLQDLLYMVNPNNEIVEDRHSQHAYNINPKPLKLSTEGTFVDDNNQ